MTGTKVISLRRSRHSKTRHLSFSDYYSGFKIDEDHEIPEDEDPLEDAMEQKGTDYQGDITLNAQEKEIIVNGTKNDSISMRAALREGHWNGNPRDDNVYIPYTISRDFRRSERRNIARAIEDYEKQTCIRYIIRSQLIAKLLESENKIAIRYLIYISYIFSKEWLRETLCQRPKEAISLHWSKDKGVIVNLEDVEGDRKYLWAITALIMLALLFMSFYMP